MSTTDTAQYIVMRVNNAVLDCPHFGGIFHKMCLDYKWKIQENNHQKRYIIYTVPKNIDYDPLTKYNEVVDNSHFPRSMIVDITLKQSRKELEEYIETIKKGSN